MLPERRIWPNQSLACSSANSRRLERRTVIARRRATSGRSTTTRPGTVANDARTAELSARCARPRRTTRRSVMPPCAAAIGSDEGRGRSRSRPANYFYVGRPLTTECARCGRARPPHLSSRSWVRAGAQAFVSQRALWSMSSCSGSAAPPSSIGGAEIIISRRLGRVRPPRHRRDVCSMAWRCGAQLSQLDRAVEHSANWSIARRL